MHDADCVAFLQWALPQLQMRWPGFRKVRRQVCKRIARRLGELNLSDGRAYQAYLSTHAAEWTVLDGLCRVSVSRFYRDKAVFASLQQDILPALRRAAQHRGADRLRAWSIGCASGEEPYSLALLWRLGLQVPGLGFDVLATEADPTLLARARNARYSYSSVKNLPPAWREQGFSLREDEYCLDPAYVGMVRFLEQDVRDAMPEERFDLILCRNLIFTYFDEPLQRRLLTQLVAHLQPGGCLVIGVHERLPAGEGGLQTYSQRLGIYRRVA